MSEMKILEIKTTRGESISMREVLRQLENMTDEQLVTLFKLIPHQAGEVKDALRRSNL